MKRLRQHLTLAEIEQHCQSCQDPIENRRWQLLLQVAQSSNVRQAAAILNVDYDYALGIIRRYNQFGPETLKDHRKIPWKQRYNSKH